jgi:hypothetical protein
VSVTSRPWSRHVRARGTPAPVERESGAESWVPVPRMPGVWVAASLGAVWGLAGYILLWGYTPIVIHRSFVVGPLGTLSLLPVRTVLTSIWLVEEHVVGRSFQLADAHGWIGVAAAAVGAAVAAVGFLAVRSVLRRARRA